MFETSQKLLLKLPPEIAHEVAISGLRLLGRLPGRARPYTVTKNTCLDVNSQTRLGLQPGWIKTQRPSPGLHVLGFGFVKSVRLPPPTGQSAAATVSFARTSSVNKSNGFQ